jgi:hypothetical protein
MTCPGITPEVRMAAEFVQRHHRHLPLDCPAMQSAGETLRRAGIWSAADIDLPPAAEPPKVTLEMQNTFCSGDRRRIVYRVLVDGQQLGTAVLWSAKTLWPWVLTIAHARIVNLGFRSREDLVEAVHHFVQTGSIA